MSSSWKETDLPCSTVDWVSISCHMSFIPQAPILVLSPKSIFWFKKNTFQSYRGYRCWVMFPEAYLGARNSLQNREVTPLVWTTQRVLIFCLIIDSQVGYDVDLSNILQCYFWTLLSKREFHHSMYNFKQLHCEDVKTLFIQNWRSLCTYS